MCRQYHGDGLERWGTVREGFPEEGSLEQNPVEADIFCKMAQGNIGNTTTKKIVWKKKSAQGNLGRIADKASAIEGPLARDAHFGKH